MKYVKRIKATWIRFLQIFIVGVFLSGCGEELKLPEGAKVIASDGPIHFIHVDKGFLGDKILQRKVGKTVCELAKTIEYCEVYMWVDREHVLTSLPMMRQEGVRRGKYTLKEGKVRLTSLQ